MHTSHQLFHTRIKPSRSASSTMRNTARSFVLPPGFINSSLPNIVQPVASLSDAIRIRGVLPISDNTPSRRSSSLVADDDDATTIDDTATAHAHAPATASGSQSIRDVIVFTHCFQLFSIRASPPPPVSRCACAPSNSEYHTYACASIVSISSSFHASVGKCCRNSMIS